MDVQVLDFIITNRESIDDRDCFVINEILKEDFSYKAISAELNLTQERVRQICHRLLKRICIDFESISKKSIELIVKEKELEERENNIKKQEERLSLKQEYTDREFPSIFYIPFNNEIEFLKIFSVRLYNILRSLYVSSLTEKGLLHPKIECLYDVISASNAEGKYSFSLLRYRNCGKKSLHELHDFFRKNGVMIEEKPGFYFRYKKDGQLLDSPVGADMLSVPLT